MVSAPLDTIDRPAASKERLRLWIRLLRTSRLIEGELRERLKTQFDSTLPRFDVLAALYRQPGGMLMSDLSRFLLVSNGNVTGIIERLVKDGLVSRAAREGDRRASIVKLTEAGARRFTEMAAAHEIWIEEFLGDLTLSDAERLSATLRAFRSNWEDGH
ncbi:MAG: MarR family winged helix-turn-helix transcriptional regulator [Aliihoeflea sp.]|uniref:MarR family winged helix-turn-helix transcriptional regulator n=1 Tax=Aliihoeflea sp. TaxID=2608088 RepID=UPI004034168E